MADAAISITLSLLHSNALGKGKGARMAETAFRIHPKNVQKRVSVKLGKVVHKASNIIESPENVHHT
uniref:Uncharacterized protein n=1 Tax=Romanomermis culicivorax TaxID=13658 RepID=A0A915IRL4_ROMCU